MKTSVFKKAQFLHDKIDSLRSRRSKLETVLNGYKIECTLNAEALSGINMPIVVDIVNPHNIYTIIQEELKSIDTDLNGYVAEFEKI